MTVTLPSPTNAGNLLIIAVAGNNVYPTPVGFTLDDEQVNNNAHYVWRKLTVNGESSWLIPFGVSSFAAWHCIELSGIQPWWTPVDRFVSAGSGAGVLSQSTGTTAATTHADDFLLATFGQWISTAAVPNLSSVNNSFSILGGTAKASGTGGAVGMSLAYRGVSATGTYEATGTFAATQGGATGILVAYKEGNLPDAVPKGRRVTLLGRGSRGY